MDEQEDSHTETSDLGEQSAFFHEPSSQNRGRGRGRGKVSHLTREGMEVLMTLCIVLIRWDAQHMT